MTRILKPLYGIIHREVFFILYMRYIVNDYYYEEVRDMIDELAYFVKNI